MLIDFKRFIATALIGKHLRFKCECMVSFDITGKILDMKIENNETIYIIKPDNSDKLIHISENHPKLRVEEV